MEPSLKDLSIEEQIAILLNTYSNLALHYTASKIRHGKVKYLCLRYNGYVVGTVGIQKVNYYLTEIKHLCVMPNFRGKGLAKKLIRMAVDAVPTSLAISTIRAENESSQAVLKSLGFEQQTAFRSKYDGGEVRLFTYSTINNEKPAALENAINGD